VTTNRLEAFSDGVIAILITIMVLEFRVPHSPHLGALRNLEPLALSYVLSFVNIGIYWSNHHHLIKRTTRVTGAVLWANLHLLFWLSLFPFATAWMGENHYGVVLLGAAVAYFTLQTVIVRNEGPNSPIAVAVGRDVKGRISLACYVVAFGVLWISRWVSVALFVLVAAMWFVPDRRLERAGTA
jgi:uncharacterized membrane protein